MSNLFDEKNMADVLESCEAEAETLLNEKDKMEEYLKKLEEKFKTIKVVGESLAEIPVMISLVRSYIKGDYEVIPMGSLIAVVCALLYFLSPVDLIPDTIPGAGYVDDAAVVAFVLNMVKFDLDLYKEWREDFFEN